ncbi:hypothetical protein P3T76_009857 [Phytophthora citrophthora]|uniref:Uncharacterized protein n=1 Tax=Phytophthora citrophthora TaxID=4793 RepID=A0AAD9GEL3_9STRA|nr:hypothetical protein P3T76_009857 [Phytophthora citrophthora]
MRTMKDRTSKKLWYKGGMAKSDYVTLSNSITDASSLDYLKCFQDALNCELDGDVQRSLVFSRWDHCFFQDGTLHLSFAVEFRLLRSTRVAKYTFELDPVSVERINILESKLRGQWDELERLRALPFAQFEASIKDARTRKLLWSAVGSNFFPVTGGNVLIRRPGVYSVTALVNNFCCNHDWGDLLKNVYVQKAAYFYADNRCRSVNSVMELVEGDTVSVACGGTVQDTCYLVIAQLGC